MATGLNTDDPMKTYIYYPGMEVRDELWLKFALIYLERLAFVFTVSEKSGLTALLDTLRQQSDLLAERPAPAFFAAITPQIENQITGLIAPDFVRHKVFGNKALITRWRQRANHDCFCPVQPGLERLHGFCLTHGFATKDEGGIRMARRFANLLSMRLAREWALANEGALITDHDYLDRLLHLLESRYHNRGGQDCFHLEIPLQVPTHLAEISFAELIALRGRSGFRQQLAAFHQALDALLAMLGSGYADPAILARFEQAQQGVTIGIRGAPAAKVQNGAVLHIAAGADTDMVHIPPCRHQGPDAGIVAEHYVSHQGGAGVHIYSFAQLWAFSFIGSQSQVHLGLLNFPAILAIPGSFLWISLYKSCGWL